MCGPLSGGEVPIGIPLGVSLGSFWCSHWGPFRVFYWGHFGVPIVVLLGVLLGSFGVSIGGLLGFIVGVF